MQSGRPTGFELAGMVSSFQAGTGKLAYRWMGPLDIPGTTLVHELAERVVQSPPHGSDNHHCSTASLALSSLLVHRLVAPPEMKCLPLGYQVAGFAKGVAASECILFEYQGADFPMSVAPQK